MASPAAKTVRLPRAERNRLILRAAARTFAREGFAAASMDAIAAGAGITKAILYRHYESKQELYRAVLLDVRQRLRDVVITGAAGPAPHAQTLRRLLETAREDPDAFTLLFERAPHEAAAEGFAGLAEVPQTADATDAIGALARWVPATLVQAIRPLMVQAILAWLRVGDPARDDLFLSRLQALLAVMVRRDLPRDGRPAADRPVDAADAPLGAADEPVGAPESNRRMP